MKEFVIYTAMRIGLFISSLVVVLAIWMFIADEVPILWAIVIAFALSGIGSYFLLDRQRQAFALRVEARAERLSSRYQEMKTREDVD